MAQLLSRSSSIAIFVSILVCHAVAFGQSPSGEELLAIIKKSEARIAELEGKTGKTAGPVAEPKPVTQASEATMTELKRDLEDLKKKDTENTPVLDFLKKL